MRSTAEKILFVPASTFVLAPTPATAAPATGQSTLEARTRADASRKPRWGPKQSILETAAASGRFKTLLRALDDTTLADVLNERGPFTLFAPTDEAFAKLPAAELSSLLADNARLRSVLSYHIVAEKVRAPREHSPNTVTAIDGQKVTMTVEHGYYKVGDAQIVKTNLRASNGVIHAIDSVLLPR